MQPIAKMPQKQCKHIHGHQAEKHFWMYTVYNVLFFYPLSCLALDSEMLKLISNTGSPEIWEENCENTECNDPKGPLFINSTSIY